MIHLAALALPVLHSAAMSLRGARAGAKLGAFLDSGDPRDLLGAAQVVLAPSHGDALDVVEHVLDILGLKETKP